MKELAARISGAELDVLEVLWQAEGPMPIADVRGALEQSHSWDSSTVKTLLRRLCEKKAVEAEAPPAEEEKGGKDEAAIAGDALKAAGGLFK